MSYTPSTGDWTLYADDLQQQARQKLEPARELWRTRILSFLKEFIDMTTEEAGPACPSCRNVQDRLSYYLEPWSLVTCQSCGEFAGAEE